MRHGEKLSVLVQRSNLERLKRNPTRKTLGHRVSTVTKITYIHMSSLSRKRRCSTIQGCCWLHCNCRILPAPRVRSEDEVCYTQFLLSSPVTDAFLQFRWWLFYRPCTKTLREEEAIPRKNIPNPLACLEWYHLVNLLPNQFAVHLSETKNQMAQRATAIWNKRPVLTEKIRY